MLSTATSISKLDQHQLTAYNQLYAKYKDDLRVHQKQKQAINDISNYVVRTTSVAYLPLIDGLDTVHERLQALKNALAPTTSGRKHDVLIQYTIRPTRHTGVQTTLRFRSDNQAYLF